MDKLEDLKYFDGVDQELEDLLNQINFAEEKFISWIEFLEWSMNELRNLEKKFDSIEYIAGLEERGETKEFEMGMCWIGAVAAYEGYMHQFFFKILDVKEFEEKILNFCKKRISEGRPLHKKMTKCDIESVKKWLSERTISNPITASNNLNEIFGISLHVPCKGDMEIILGNRNSLAHKGLVCAINVRSINMLCAFLNKMACDYTEAIQNELNKMLRKVENIS